MANPSLNDCPPAGTDTVRVALAEMRSELELVYALEDKLDRETHGQARLSRLVGEFTRFLNMSYSALLIPARNIRVRITHRNWKSVDRVLLDQRILKTFLPRYADVERPVLLQLDDTPHGATGRQGQHQMILLPLRNEAGDAIGVFVSFCQVAGKPLTAVAERLLVFCSRLAMRIVGDSYDRLTGLMRRQDFTAIVDRLMSEGDNGDDAHCLVYFDIDQLQAVNDTFDQRAGDDVLLRFSRLITSELPSGGSIARIESDKFAALLRHRDLNAGQAFAEAVRTGCQKLVYLRGENSLPVTVSAGVVPLDDERVMQEHPLTVARMACTKAKDHGGDRVECYSPDDRSIVRRVDNLQVFARLQEAIKNEAFVLDAQPIVALGEQPVGPHFEILLRMQGPGGDVLLPEQFFSAAEQYQLMPKLDRHVLNRFFREVAKADDLLSIHEATFSLNLSGQSLSEPAFHEFVRQLVLDSMLNPSQLCFEVTETAAIANRKAAISFMHTMRRIGCRFALDDFGAGLSSFAYLRDMPVDVLKIDGSFVRDLDTNKVSESMVAAVAQVARVMGLKTVAEFVETEAVLEGLQRLGVDFGQGFLLGRPRPLREQLESLAENGLDPRLIMSFTDAVVASHSLGNT